MSESFSSKSSVSTEDIKESPNLDNAESHSSSKSTSESVSNETNKECPILILNEIRKKNPDRLIFGHINLNSLRNKFQPFKTLIEGKCDIILLSEIKLDSSFPAHQFDIEGYSSFRLDRDARGGGILLYVREDIPSKLLKKHNIHPEFEGFFIELNFKKNKWICACGYNPTKENISSFLNHMSKGLDAYLGDYDNIVVIGDFNSEVQEEAMKDFCETYNLKNLIDFSTCYKNPNNPSSIDVILTNRANNFCDSTTVETGLSDYHKLTLTVLKTYFKKKAPIKIMYRSYKNYDEANFKSDLAKKLNDLKKDSINYDNFLSTFLNVLNDHAPIKYKMIRGNNCPFMTKILSKSFMERSRLKNNYNKNPTVKNEKMYKKHRNFCVNLLKKEKRNYYSSLNLNIFKDNKTFWKNIKPLLSDRYKSFSKNFTLLVNNEILSDQSTICESLNDFFIQTIDDIGIEPYLHTFNDANSHDKSIDDIVNEYDSHPSILKIKESFHVNEIFKFHPISSQNIKEEIGKLDGKKAIPPGDIPVKILKATDDVISEYLTLIYNKSEKETVFPPALKLANVIPIHKKNDTNLMENYRPVSLLPAVSKLFEKDMYSQILTHITKYLSPSLFGFRKGHSTEHCLLLMLELWRKALDSRQYAGAILTDLSKAFDCINHELLIAKLSAYGFGDAALEFIYSYLNGRKQRTKLGPSVSSWKETKKGVPQGSILGPLLFNIFLNDMFLFTNETKIANYADDNTPYLINKDVNYLLAKLQEETMTILNWFKLNEMKANNDKCHLIVTKKEVVSVKLGEETIHSTPTVNLLGVLIDNKLTFSKHVLKLCKKGNQKLHALARIAKYLDKDKLRALMNAFIKSQFNYCSLIWMFHSRTLNNKINRLHERALRIVYKDYNSTFKELLQLDNSFTIHEMNLQKLATEMYKIKNQLSPTLVQGLFTDYDNSYGLRNQRCWATNKVNTVNNGTETFLYRGPKIWEVIPAYIKDSPSLDEFKAKIKQWKPRGCTCRLCNTFVPNLGFLH